MPTSYEKPIVAIVGRANVGKSSLFNRLVGETQAIVTNTPGTTRDRLYGTVAWNNHDFILVDTAGLDFAESDPYRQDVIEQIELAAAEATLILYVVDGREGLVPQDEKIARWLRRKKVPTLVVVNKIDNPDRQADALLPFFELGFHGPYAVSALSGKQSGDLLDAVVRKLPKPVHYVEDDVLRVALIGRPNVGKSSLFNALVGKRRAVVGAKPGTTRDFVIERIDTPQGTVELIDTAGLRRKSKVKNNIEKLSILQSLRAIDRANVVLFVIDSEERLTHNEMQLAQYITETGRAMAILANKSDTQNEKEQYQVGRYIQDKMPYLAWAPILFTSATMQDNITEILPLAYSAHANAQRTMSDADVATVIEAVVKRHKPPKAHGSIQPIITGLKQTGTLPPKFLATIIGYSGFTRTYSRFIERGLREFADFTGTPIFISYRAKPQK